MANQCVSTGCSGPRKAATQRNMQREERVTVQGPGKKINNVSSPLDGMQMELDLPKTRIDKVQAAVRVTESGVQEAEESTVMWRSTVERTTFCQSQ